jgi:hypothetical protein
MALATENCHNRISETIFHSVVLKKMAAGYSFPDLPSAVGKEVNRYFYMAGKLKSIFPINGFCYTLLDKT